EKCWRDDKLEDHVRQMAQLIQARLKAVVDAYPKFDAEVRGRGLFIGMDCADAGLAKEIAAACFQGGLICETAGAQDNVVKAMPPLTTPKADIEAGLDILESSVKKVLD